MYYSKNQITKIINRNAYILSLKAKIRIVSLNCSVKTVVLIIIITDLLTSSIEKIFNPMNILSSIFKHQKCKQIMWMLLRFFINQSSINANTYTITITF